MIRGRTAALLLIVVTGAFPGSAGDDADLLISTAVSLKEPLLAAIDDFAESRGGSGFPAVDVHAAGSSVLAGQILRGAPTDLFVSASRPDVERLVAAGLVDRSSICSLVGNVLVIVVPAGDRGIDGLEQLRDSRFERIGVANPRTAPLGRYTAQALEAAGLLGLLADRRIIAGHARQVVDYVARGEVDAAVVYATDAARFADRVSVALEIDPGLHEPVEYVVAHLGRNDPASWSAQLFDHLCSDAGRARFEEAGFTPWPGPH
ncbi:MAG: molybdate ABC transporter substrate-binding protein [Acidobacteria bacterium]|nr:molybdate ABC transporter substrate-binding protein [Acidobacteriota bacterium]NIM62224.1 molybdate ABC transporter substrate-binding protein [Acidobacteriota bacterium]NIO59006.1 molybdate ABC transporter substrate-binding protein [Acidobacteriota bacterium]NIQ30052.1 molybdate ABC transporter substrate-binding protein [Acidobacteriota bacterium]NIQ84818.1 molybdate ABC transporter substrate-binding protein [Acidobacteriota bacterium]